MSVDFLGKKTEVPPGQPYSVVQLLRQTMGGNEAERPFLPAHASDVTRDDFCAREVALHARMNRCRPAKYISPALRATFDQGRAIEKLVRENWSANKVWGNWECTSCGMLREFAPKPSDFDTTITCKRHHWKYHEVGFSSHGITSSPDGLWNLGAPLLYVVETKIMAPELFKALKAPLFEHRVRTNLYLRLIEDSDHPQRHRVNTQRGFVLYISRGHGNKNDDHAGSILPFKEFVVERNDDELVQALANAAAVHEYQTLGVFPKGICPTPLCKRAKFCRVNKECFSGMFPAP